MGNLAKTIYEYRLLDTATGLYSTGGWDPKWRKQGKTWHSINHVKAHITYWRGKYRQYNPTTGNYDTLYYREVPSSWVIVKTVYQFQKEEHIAP